MQLRIAVSCRKIGISFVCILLFVGLTGCGVGNITGGESQKTVSGGAVSGSSSDERAADAAKKADQSMKKVNRFVNDNSRYREEEKGDDTILVQQKLDGTLVEEFAVPDLYFLCGVTNQWVYYSTIDYSLGDDMPRDVWRTPIVKKKDGDHLNWKKKEKLFRLDYLEAGDMMYVTDSYIIYRGITEDMVTEALYQFDLEKKKSEQLFTNRSYIVASDLGDEECYVKNGSLLVATEEDLGWMEPQSGKLEKIYSGLDLQEIPEGILCVSQCGQELYFTPDHWRVCRYRDGDTVADCVMEKGDIQRKLEEIVREKKGKEVMGPIKEMFAYQDRMYLSISAQWRQPEHTEAGKRKIERNQEILLSVAVDHISDLRYETAVTQYLEKHASLIKATRKEKGNKFVSCDLDGYFYQINGARAVYMLNYTKGSTKPKGFACYNLETGKMRKSDDEGKHVK